MEFFINNKKYSYTEDELNLRLISDEGTEGNVYDIKGEAVKIYKEYCRKIRLTEEDVERLKSYNTKRLLLPIQTVYDENKKFNGYTTKLINSANKATIGKMKMTKMLEEMDLLKEDVKLLTNDNITVEDLSLDNIVYGNGIYVCDPGSYVKEKVLSKREVERENKYNLNNLFIDEIFGLCCKLTKKQKLKLKELVTSGEYLSEIFFCEDINYKESTSQFIKRITK